MEEAEPFIAKWGLTTSYLPDDSSCPGIVFHGIVYSLLMLDDLRQLTAYPHSIYHLPYVIAIVYLES